MYLFYIYIYFFFFSFFFPLTLILFFSLDPDPQCTPLVTWPLSTAGGMGKRLTEEKARKQNKQFIYYFPPEGR